VDIIQNTSERIAYTSLDTPVKSGVSQFQDDVMEPKKSDDEFLQLIWDGMTIEKQVDGFEDGWHCLSCLC